jgi:hypothetical protein
MTRNLKIKILYRHIGKNVSKLLNKYHFLFIPFFLYSCVKEPYENIKVINIFCKTTSQNVVENNKNFISKRNSDFLKSYGKIIEKKFSNSNLIVQLDEKRRGGYSLNLNRIIENKIYFLETSPQERTASIAIMNFPYCEIELNIIPENLEIIFEK